MLASAPRRTWADGVPPFTYGPGLIYLEVSVSLNVLLTSMIVLRLALHDRSVRAAMGTPGRIGGLYKAIVTMLIESCALYAVASLLVIGPANARDISTAAIFLPILAQTQVRTFLWPRIV